MRKIVVFMLFSSWAFAQQSANQDIEKPIRDLFLGMKNADSQLIQSVFTDTAILQTITKEGTVKSEEIKNFIASISTVAKGDLDERITIKALNTDGNLASVFTPYQLYYKEKLLHCGANSFQLVKQKNSWKIQYLIDTRRKCDAE